MKFKVGDRIKVSSSDRVGYAYANIERIDEGTEPTYWVRWEHHNHRLYDYKVVDVDGDWEHACPVVLQASGVTTITLPLPPQGATHYNIYRHQQGKGYVKIQTDHVDRNLSEICNHKWEDYYGFSECYQFCQHCDEKRPLVWFK